MPTVDQVADYFIGRAREVGEPITNLKVQKLVYYAQAWYLALYGKTLFDGDFEAWVHGPVNPTLYKRFRRFGWKSIDSTIEQPTLDAQVHEHLEEVWEVYGGLSAWDLERLTHQEEPWQQPRVGLASDEYCDTAIDPAIMATYYRRQKEDADV